MSEDVLSLATICGTVVAVSAMLFVNRLLERRHERRLTAPTPMPTSSDDADRLDRMERAIEATALEVERVSEASRYLVKLLSDRSAAMLPSRSERVITPH